MVAPEKIKDAQGALIAKLWADHKPEMRELNKGDKPSDDVIALIDTVTKAVAKGFED